MTPVNLESGVRTSTLLLLFFSLVTSVSAQKAFESGYLIDGSGRRREVSIRNEDWRFHPTKIEYRLPGDSLASIIKTASLREFGIDGKARYVNLPVLIEKSSTEQGHLPTEAPVPQTETTLLRVEVEGEATLYSYLAARVQKLFLSIDGQAPGQLLHTRVLVEPGRVAENNLFQTQLAAHLDCGAVGTIDPQLRYDLRRIKRLVMDYNDCAGGGSEVVYSNEHADHRAFRLTLLAGVFNGSYRIKNEQGSIIADLEKQYDLRVGVDFEFIPPFGNDKFSVLVRPSYYAFRADNASSQHPNELPASTAYHALTIPFALRYYSFIGTGQGLYLTAGLGPAAHLGETNINLAVSNSFQLWHTAQLEAGIRLADRWNLSVAYEYNGSITTINRRRVSAPGVMVLAGLTL